MSFVRKHMGTLVIVVLAIAATGYYFLVDKGQVTTTEADNRKFQLLPVWRRDDLGSLKVERAEGAYALERVGAGDARTWDVRVGETRFPAEEQVVDKLLQSLEYARFQREVPKEGIDREAFGLNSPRAVVTIGMKDLVVMVRFGTAGPGDGSVYAEVVDRGVFVISTDLLASVLLDPDELRSKNFVPYLSTELKEIAIEGEGGPRIFVRAPWTGGRGSGFRWKSSPPASEGVRVDGEALDRALVSLGRMQAEAFLTDLEIAKRETARVKLTLTPKEGPAVTIELGGACPRGKASVIAVRSGPTKLGVCVPENVMPALERSAVEFEDRGLIGASADEIAEVQIKEGDKTLDLARSGTGFKLRAPKERAIAAAIGGPFLDGLLKVRGEFAEPKDEAVGDPVRLTVRSAAGAAPDGTAIERVEEVEVFSTSDADRKLVVRKEDGARLIVSARAAAIVSASDTVLRDTRILTLKTGDIVEVKLSSKGLTQRFVREDSGLTLKEPTGKNYELDLGFAQDTLEMLSSLEALRFVPDAEATALGFDAPRAVVEISVKGSAKRILTLGAPVLDGVLTRIEGEPGVFVASPSFDAAMRRLLLSRIRFVSLPADVTQVSIEANKKKLTFDREGAIFTTKEAGGPTLAAVFSSAFEDFLPLEAVALGPAKPEHGISTPVLEIVLHRKAGELRYRVGAGDVVDGLAVHFARRDDIDATWALPRDPVKKLLALLEK